MAKGPPMNTARPEKAPGAPAENKATVQRARRRPFLVRFLRRAITRKAVVNAVPLIVIVQVLYLTKGGAGVLKFKQRTNVIQDGRSLRDNAQQEKDQLDQTSLRKPVPPARSNQVAMLCTVGSKLPLQVPVYPADGVCTWIAYIHARYDGSSAILVPSTEGAGNHRAWFYFRRYVGMYNRTRLLPSLEWAHFRRTLGEGLNAFQARSLNRTLVNTGMTGLSMLNVLADVGDLRSLSRVLATLAGANQGMFLALGLRLLGLLDSTATRIVPGKLVVNGSEC
ncbi:uncharacterized protein LOC142767184 [Rhipicephalus microplus]|uniref:uncharacterized protein LOC142767184 n=1 Tax=Rhipicephalus microplus TaxID=6941 RepID=UPI003F6C2D8A